MDSKQRRIYQTAKELAELIEASFARMPHREAAAKRRALKKALDKLGSTDVKPAARLRLVANRRKTLRPAKKR